MESASTSLDRLDRQGLDSISTEPRQLGQLDSQGSSLKYLKYAIPSD
jgi:hypothetical protein